MREEDVKEGEMLCIINIGYMPWLVTHLPNSTPCYMRWLCRRKREGRRRKPTYIELNPLSSFSASSTCWKEPNSESIPARSPTSVWDTIFNGCGLLLKRLHPMAEKVFELIVGRFMYADGDKLKVSRNGSKEQLKNVGHGWWCAKKCDGRLYKQEGKGSDMAVQ